MTRSGMDLAFAATLHCLTGCAIGEVLGMALGAVLGWSNLATIVASIVLVFAFGYGLTIRSLVKGGLPLTAAARIALASDSLDCRDGTRGDRRASRERVADSAGRGTCARPPEPWGAPLSLAC